jgi:hypothetical protein
LVVGENEIGWLRDGRDGRPELMLGDMAALMVGNKMEAWVVN